MDVENPPKESGPVKPGDMVYLGEIDEEGDDLWGEDLPTIHLWSNPGLTGGAGDTMGEWKKGEIGVLLRTESQRRSPESVPWFSCHVLVSGNTGWISYYDMFVIHPRVVP